MIRQKVILDLTYEASGTFTKNRIAVANASDPNKAENASGANDGEVLGVFMNSGTTGETARICALGVYPISAADSAVANGEMLISDADGKADTATLDTTDVQNCVGSAMDDASAEDELIPAFICPSKYAYESEVTKTHAIALTDLRCENAVKDALPDTPDGDGGTLGLADAAGSPVVGTTTNGGATANATEKCSFDYVVPADYVAGEDIVCRVKGLVSAARNAESLLDVVVKHVKAGALDATDLCTTAAIDMKDVTTEANEDFTIDSDSTGDELAAGSVLHVEVSFETDDTGATADGYAQINGIEMRVPCYR